MNADAGVINKIMIINERAIPIFIVGVIVLIAALTQRKIGIAFSYKDFRRTIVFKKEESEKESFKISTTIQLIVGIILIAISII